MKNYYISPDASLIECMRNMDITGAGIALAVDTEFRLIGTISDGDVRKALVKGCSLDSSVSPHINRSCFYVLPSVPRAEVLDVMQARRFGQVPIVDEQGKVIGLHLLHDILGRVALPNWAIVMAGGQGVRLRPLTENIPKPMIRVAGRPILERIVLHLVSYGIRRIFLSVNHLAHVIEDYFKDGSKYGAKIEYLHEDEPLGSGGAISLLPKIPEQALLVMNGDLIVDTNFTEMIQFHSQNDFYATMGIHPYLHQVPYGCIEIQNNRLAGLEEKPILEKMVNAGIYVLSPQAISAIPKNTYFPITTLFEDAIKNNLVCGTFPVEKEWLDIGSPQQLRQARGEL
ncbi:MAG: nucleotidyltransferase family protein [Deltaproteobacteria bacterium]|nr:nucleotidyltransferase family protein [Deltaproteobacteria bacterium]